MANESGEGKPGDYPVEEVLKNMEHWASKGALCFIKYTCVTCGSRQTSDEANTWRKDGYICSECGGLTVPKGINFMLALAPSANGEAT